MYRQLISSAAVFTISGALLLGVDATTAHADSHAAPKTVQATTSSSPRVAKPSGFIYVVRSGDTLTGIAAEHKQEYTDLLARNQQFWSNPDLIYPGDKVRLDGAVLKVPASKRPAQSAQPKTAAPTRTPHTNRPRSAPKHPATGSAKAYARSVLSASQFACLDTLIARESGWNVYATNPYSGAYGIPQALPGSKMASAGPDWRTNGVTQIKWGLRYIASTYGTPCAALAHSNRTGWY